MSNSEYILSIRNLSAGYNGSLVLKKLDMNMEAGEILAVIGQNGCGKSTLLKSIFQLTPNICGNIIFKGVDIMNMPTDRLLEMGMSYFMQGGLIFPGLTVKEHLDLAVKQTRKRNNFDEIIGYFPDLAGCMKKRAGNLSGGQRQNLSLAMMLAQQTSLWLLDEPIAGLDPERAEMTIEFIDKMNKEKTTSVLLVEHNYEAAFKLAQNVCVIKDRNMGVKFPQEIFKQNNFLDNYVYV